MTPIRPDIGVLALVPEPWGRVMWMARHQIVTRLARYFNVVWFDPAREWRQLWLHTSAPAPAERPLDPGFAVYRSGRFLPLLHRPRALADLIARIRLHRAAALLRRRGARKIVLYIWRPALGRATEMVDHDASVYHIVDEYTFSPVEKPLDEAEASLIRRVSQVIVHSPALFEKKGHLNPHTTIVPNGVDYDAFATPRTEPSDLREIPHPRIGYVGMIKEQLDLPLLAGLAEKHPRWQFVFVGPNRVSGDAAMERLRSSPNVHFLGLRPSFDVPAYTQHMDVGIMPYVLDGYTKFIYPLKVHEYFASGLPVVATPIQSLQRFAHVLTLARGEEEWSTALGAALSERDADPAVSAERRALAAEHDWDHLVLRIADTFCERLGERGFSDR